MASDVGILLLKGIYYRLGIVPQPEYMKWILSPQQEEEKNQLLEFLFMYSSFNDGLEATVVSEVDTDTRDSLIERHIVDDLIDLSAGRPTFSMNVHLDSNDHPSVHPDLIGLDVSDDYSHSRESDVDFKNVTPTDDNVDILSASVELTEMTEMPNDKPSSNVTNKFEISFWNSEVVEYVDCISKGTNSSASDQSRVTASCNEESTPINIQIVDISEPPEDEKDIVQSRDNPELSIDIGNNASIKYFKDASSEKIPTKRKTQVVYPFLDGKVNKNELATTPSTLVRVTENESHWPVWETGELMKFGGYKVNEIKGPPCTGTNDSNENEVVVLID